MYEYVVSKIYSSNARANEQVTELLEAENIRRDKNLDYTCGIFDGNNELIATGSCFGNTLRCMAVSSRHQGEGLMNLLLTHLINYQYSRGFYHLFLYTKCGCSKIFGDLGFYEIARIDEQLVFMENKKNGFADFLEELKKPKEEHAKVAAIVMNANPFSLGHQYLVEKAASESEMVHLFLVREDSSIFPYEVRKKLVEAGTAHLPNVIIHSSGPYIISNATFPSYFQKDSDSVIQGHALLDITIFQKIAAALGITARYVGEEPYSQVTNIYNNIMREQFAQSDISFIVVPRKEVEEQVISASTIRKAIQEDDFDFVKTFVPRTTFDFLLEEEAQPIIEKICASANVIHY